jgi:hypothetical protein
LVGVLLRDWLRRRGLRPDTVAAAGLGLRQGRLLIPWCQGGRLVAVNSRGFGSGLRYCLWRGSSRGVYPGGALVDGLRVLVCEGELDCLLAAQELGDLVQALTFGSAHGRPVYGPLACRLDDLGAYLALDADEAGDRGSERLRPVLPNAVRLRPPEGMDLTDVHRAVGLRTWFAEEVSTATGCSRTWEDE